MEHAVIVHLRLTDDNFGDETEREEIFALEDRLIEALEGRSAGEFDGNEFGGGECTFYMYGEDADLMFNAVSPVLKSSRLSAGGYVVKRYGEAADPLATEVKLPL